MCVGGETVGLSGPGFASAAHAIIGELRDALVANHGKADKGPLVQSKQRRLVVSWAPKDMEDGTDSIVNGAYADPAQPTEWRPSSKSAWLVRLLGAINVREDQNSRSNSDTAIFSIPRRAIICESFFSDNLSTGRFINLFEIVLKKSRPNFKLPPPPSSEI